MFSIILVSPNKMFTNNLDMKIPMNPNIKNNLIKFKKTNPLLSNFITIIQLLTLIICYMILKKLMIIYQKSILVSLKN